MNHPQTLAHRAAKYLAANEAAKNDYDDETYERLERLEVAAYETEAKTVADVAAFLKLLKDHFTTAGVNDWLLSDSILKRLEECINITENAQE